MEAYTSDMEMLEDIMTNFHTESDKENISTIASVVSNGGASLTAKQKDEESSEQIGSSSANPFQCEQCPKTYQAKSSLLRHIQAHHKKTKPLPHHCDICEMGFRAAASLRAHMKKIHDIHTPKRVKTVRKARITRVANSKTSSPVDGETDATDEPSPTEASKEVSEVEAACDSGAEGVKDSSETRSIKRKGISCKINSPETQEKMKAKIRKPNWLKTRE